MKKDTTYFWSIIIIATFVVLIGFVLPHVDENNEKEYSLKTVTLYDNSGNIINTWEGASHVSQSKNGVFFEVDGKEVAIYNSIVTIEEE